VTDLEERLILVAYEPLPGHQDQPFFEVRHLSGGTWKVIDTGTAQVACDPQVPASVQADFADVLGGC